MATEAVGWNRSQFVEFIRQKLQPLEHLLKPGDRFDYENLSFGSVILNGTAEEAVTVFLTEDSPSIVKSKAIGDEYTWLQLAPLPLYGFYVFPPVEAFHDLDAHTPYLARALGWGEAEYVDADGNFVRSIRITWARPTGAYAHVKLMPHDAISNWEVHGTNSATTTTNQ